MKSYYLETERLILRNWEDEDIEPFCALNSDEKVMEFFPDLFSIKRTKAGIARYTSDISNYNYGFFAAERKDNSEFIGMVGIAPCNMDAPFCPCVEVGWRISKANWGLGFATEAAKACIDYGFNMGIKEIYSFTATPNKRSENVMKKIGMSSVGTFFHPLIDSNNHLCEHLLYKLNSSELLR